MKIDEVRRALENFSEVEFHGGVSEAAVETASRSIGVPFPPEYREFLLEFGSGYVSSEDFVGLGGPKHLDIVWLTNDLRNRYSTTRFSRSLLPIRSDGYGNYDCIDTSIPTAAGEFEVVEWRHDAGDQQACRKLAESYSQWFISILNDVRQLDAEEGS